MKKLVLYLAAAGIILGAFYIQQYMSYVGPQIAQREAIKNDINRVLLEKEQLDMRHKLTEEQIRREAVTNAFPYGLLIFCGIVVSTTGLVLYLRYDKRRESWHRQIDGSFALQDMTVNGVKWKVDINKTPSGAIGAGPNGMLLQAPVDGTFGPDRQLDYNKKIQNTRTAIAVSGESGIPNAATGKFLAGAYDRTQKLLSVKPEEIVEPESVEKEPVKLLSLDEAIRMSNKNSWIVGQDEETGELSEINIRDVVNVGIVGSTKTGKTSSTGLLTAYYARKSGYHVIVLDAKGLMDWQPFSSVFEVHMTNSNVFRDQIFQLGEIYAQRKQIVADKSIQDFYDELDSHKMVPIIVILEEFGSLCDTLKGNNRKDYDYIIKALSTMMRDCRAVGMSLIFIDQETTRWEPVIKSLVKYWVAFKLEAGAGKGIGFHYLPKLKNAGEFASSTNKSTKFKAWHTKALLDVRTKLKPSVRRLIAESDAEVNFTNPFERLHETKKPAVVESAVVNVIDEETENETEQITAPACYEDLTERDKTLIRNLHHDGVSLRAITKTVFGGRWGQFYNDIVKKVVETDSGN